MVLKAPGTVWTRGTQLVQLPRCPGNGWTPSFQPPGILGTGGSQSFQPHRYPGNCCTLNLSPPGTLGTSETPQFQAPGYHRYWRDSVISAPQVRCGQTGTQSPQLPRYVGHWRELVIPSHMVIQARTRGTPLVQLPRYSRNCWIQLFQSPGILGTGGTQSFQAPESY